MGVDHDCGRHAGFDSIQLDWIGLESIGSR